MQIISKDKTVRNNTVQDLKDFSSQARKAEQLVSMMPAIRKVSDLMGNHMVELSTENECLEIK